MESMSSSDNGNITNKAYDIISSQSISDSSRSIITDIRDHYGNQRKRSIAKKKWIFELIQNAIDTLNTRLKNRIEKHRLSIIIKIQKFNGKVEFMFKHNGGYFTLNELLALILGGSTKPFNPSPKGTLGMFGKGFLLTHILSRIVFVNGYLKVEDKIYTFNIEINRNYDDPKKLAKNIRNIINNLGRHMKLNINPPKLSEMYTTFKYPVGEDNYEALQEGIEILKNHAPILLALNDSIETIRIEEPDEIHEYKKIKESSINSTLNEIIVRHSVKKNNNENRDIVILMGTKTCDLNVKTLLLLLKSETNGYDIADIGNVSKIYIQLPLIGENVVDKIRIPYIINSSGFQPSSDRGDLIYTGREKYKEIFKTSLDLYDKILEYIFNNELYKKINNLYKLANLIKHESSNEDPWSIFNKVIIKKRDEILSKYPFVKTSNGEYKKLEEVVFPVKYFSKDDAKNQVEYRKLTEDEYKILKELVSQIKDIPHEAIQKEWIETAVILYRDDIKVNLWGYKELKEYLEAEIDSYTEKNEKYPSCKKFSNYLKLICMKDFYKSLTELILSLYERGLLRDASDIIKYWPNQSGILRPSKKSTIVKYSGSIHVSNIRLYVETNISKDLKDILAHHLYFPIYHMLVDRGISYLIREKLKDKADQFINLVFAGSLDEISAIKILLDNKSGEERSKEGQLYIIKGIKEKNKISERKLSWKEYLKEVIRNKPDDDFIEGWIQLFNYCVHEELLDKIIDSSHSFSVITKENKIEELNWLNNEKFILPFKYIFNVDENELICSIIEDDRSISFEKIYPSNLILNEKYFKERDKPEKFIRKLTKYRAFTTIPNVREFTEIKGEIMHYIHKDNSNNEIRKKIHRLESSVELYDIPLWSNVIGIIQNKKNIAKCFIEFIIKFLMDKDKPWWEKATVKCQTCNRKHEIIKAVWLGRILTSEWIKMKIPMGGRYEEQYFRPSKNTIYEILNDDDISKLIERYSNNAIEFFSNIGFGKIDLLIRKYTGKVSEDLIANVFEPIMEQIIEYKIKDPKLIEEIVERVMKEIVTLRRIRRYMEVGKEFEHMLKNILEERGLNVEKIHVGADFELFNPQYLVGERSDQSDLGLYNVGEYIVEVKFTVGDRVKLSMRQVEKALMEKNRYIVVVGEHSNVVELIENDTPIEKIIKSIKEKINKIYVIEKLYEVICQYNQKYIEFNYDGLWIKNNLWIEKGIPLLEWITKRLKKG